MRYFVVILAATLWPVDGATLTEVYGRAPVVQSMTPWHKRAKKQRTNNIFKDEDYYAVRDPEQCIFPLEVVLVQDTTSSTTDNFINMRETQLDLMIDALSQDHPNSRFGVTSFRDKPIWTLGSPDSDYCFAVESPISDDTSLLHKVYSNIIPIGGGDPAENQMGALLATAQSSVIGWGNEMASRLMILITDAQPHFEGDGFQREEYNMLPFVGVHDEANPSEQCLGEYYPHPDQLVQSIVERETYVAFIVYDGSYQHGLPSDAWKWFNSYLGQTEAFVGDLGEGSTSFWESLAQVIREIELVECIPRTTLQPTTPERTVTESGEAEISTREAETTPQFSSLEPEETTEEFISGETTSDEIEDSTSVESTESDSTSGASPTTSEEIEATTAEADTSPTVEIETTSAELSTSLENNEISSQDIVTTAQTASGDDGSPTQSEDIRDTVSDFVTLTTTVEEQDHTGTIGIATQDGITVELPNFTTGTLGSFAPVDPSFRTVCADC